MATRTYSDIQEKRIAELLNGKVQSNSGGTKFGGGDIHTSQFLIEAKTNIEPKKTFTLKEEWISKMKEQAFEQGKQYSALAVSFDGENDYFLVDSNTFKEMIKMTKNGTKTRFHYQTNFTLTCPIKSENFEQARDYLVKDDMTEYLKGHCATEDCPLLARVIYSIEWNLLNEESGVIDLYTSTSLSENERWFISGWISGQNSDGLGEGFEQQDFAYVVDEVWDDDDNFADGEMARFDWQSNDYYLSEVEDD